MDSFVFVFIFSVFLSFFLSLRCMLSCIMQNKNIKTTKHFVHESNFYIWSFFASKSKMQLARQKTNNTCSKFCHFFFSKIFNQFAHYTRDCNTLLFQIKYFGFILLIEKFACWCMSSHLRRDGEERIATFTGKKELLLLVLRKNSFLMTENTLISYL